MKLSSKNHYNWYVNNVEHISTLFGKKNDVIIIDSKNINDYPWNLISEVSESLIYNCIDVEIEAKHPCGLTFFCHASITNISDVYIMGQIMSFDDFLDYLPEKFHDKIKKIYFKFIEFNNIEIESLKKRIGELEKANEKIINRK